MIGEKRRYIEARAGFSPSICDKSIQLLRAIKEYLLSFEETRHELAAIFEAFNNFILRSQKDIKVLLDYDERFMSRRDILASHLGSDIILTKCTISYTF